MVTFIQSHVLLFDQPARSSHWQHLPEQQRHEYHVCVTQHAQAARVLCERPVRSVHGTMQMQCGNKRSQLAVYVVDSYVYMNNEGLRRSQLWAHGLSRCPAML